MNLDLQSNITLYYLQRTKTGNVVWEPQSEEGYTFLVGRFDRVLVVVVFDVVQKVGPTKRESVLRRKGWIEGFPKGESPVIAATSKKVGVNIPQGIWNALVEPSQKYRDASNMQGLTRWAYLDTWIRSEIPALLHWFWRFRWTLLSHVTYSLLPEMGMGRNTLAFASMNLTASTIDLSKSGGAAGLYPGKEGATAFGEDFGSARGSWNASNFWSTTKGY